MTETTPAQRTALHYCTDGLSALDELMFKAFVRMLDNRTLHRWIHVQQTPELWVIGGGVDELKLQGQLSKSVQVLALGVTRIPQDGYVSLPLRAASVEAELNRLGTVLALRAVQTAPAQDKGNTVAPWPPQAPGTASEVQSRPPSAFFKAKCEVSLMRLLRWPPPKLVVTMTRMRLASMLTGKPVSLITLSARSDVPLPDCYAFLAEMHDADLLAYSDFSTLPVVAPQGSAPAPAGVPYSAPAHTPALRTHAGHAPAPRTLLDRIRLRLSLGSRGQATSHA